MGGFRFNLKPEIHRGYSAEGCISLGCGSDDGCVLTAKLGAPV